MKGRQNHLKSVSFLLPNSVTQYKTYPEIINYVSTFNLKVKMDVNKTILALPSSMRNERRFAALIMRLWPFTCLHFPTGNMVIGGAKTYYGVLSTAHEYRLFIEKIHHEFYDENEKKFYYATLEGKTSFDGFLVSNVVGCGNLLESDDDDDDDDDENDNDNDDDDDNVNRRANKKERRRKRINLNQIAQENLSSGLDKEVFPALLTMVKRSEEVPLETCLATKAHIFNDGKDVIMGAGNETDIYMVHEHLRKLIKTYGKTGNERKNLKFVRERRRRKTRGEERATQKKETHQMIEEQEEEESESKADIFKNLEFKQLKQQQEYEDDDETNNQDNEEEEDDEINVYKDGFMSMIFSNKKINSEEEERYQLNDFFD